MVSPIIQLTLILLVSAAAVITGVAIYNHKKRQPTRLKALDETQPTVIAEKHVAPQEPQLPVVQEAEPTVTEETPLTPVAETKPTEIHEAHLPAMAETQPTEVEEAQSTKGQEAQPIAEKTSWATVQETQETDPAKTPPTIKEIQTSRAEETQAIAIEHAQTVAAEETEPTRTESPQEQETIKDQPEGPGEALVDEINGKLEPIKRGGKPRGPAQDPPELQNCGISTRRSKLEIVCWKRERQWVVAVEVPEELLDNSRLTVLQNGISLSHDQSEETCWLLKQVTGEVTVSSKEDGADHEAKVDLGQDNYLLFRLIGQNLNQGYRVKSPSSGSYLVIAPKDWKREETVSGPPPIAPEPVHLEGYKAHFFDLEKGDEQKIAFQLPNGQSQVIKAKAPRFDLVGNRIEDASEYMGPLFGERPPRIRALDPQAWNNVKTIVVGEEGIGQRRWRKAFSPNSGQPEQDLPSELTARKGGWYFLRFYDNNDDLIESIDFRFLSVLKKISVPQPHPFPAGDGHKPVYVEFLHEPDCMVEPKSGLENIQVKRQNEKTILSIPPYAACDESQWIVSSKAGAKVEVTINIERIWWAVGEETDSPSDWQDRPVILSRQDFKATSNKALWLRFPRQRWTDKVFVGFERSRARAYGVRVTERSVAIPLREYSDYAEVGDQTQQHSVRIWISHDQQDKEGVVAVIRADQLPRIEREQFSKELVMIPASELASVLSRLRRKTSGPLRTLIKQVRRTYRRESTARKDELISFKKYAPCMIAFTIGLIPNAPGVKKRYRNIAKLAQANFPQIMDSLKARYEEISAI